MCPTEFGESRQVLNLATFVRGLSGLADAEGWSLRMWELAMTGGL